MFLLNKIIFLKTLTIYFNPITYNTFVNNNVKTNENKNKQMKLIENIK